MRLLDAASWIPRASGSSVVLPDGSIVLMGGSGGGVSGPDLNDVWRSADDGMTWNEMTPNAQWAPRQDFSAVAMPDGSIVVMGGGLDNGQDYNDVWRSTDDGATWNEMTPNAQWAPRQDFGAVAMPDGSIVVMGGGGGYNQYYNDVWRSTDNGATWTEMNASPGWTPRSGLNSVVLQDGSIVIMGGTSLDQSPFEYIYFNDVWRSTDNGATWTEMTSNAGWVPREQASSMTMPDGSIVLLGGTGNGFWGQDVWRSTNNGATWTQTNLAVMPPDVGTVLGSWQTVDTGGDWLNTSSTVEINSGQPSMVVLTLETPGIPPSVIAELFEMTVDQNGTVNGLKEYPNQSTLNYDSPQPFLYSNTSLKGLRGTQIDDMIYAFYSLDPTHLAVSTINIADQPQNNTVYKDEVVLNTQQVNYVSGGDMMSTFQVLGAENGIYLVSKQVSSQGSPVLDISFIPVNQLGAGENSIITPQSLMQVPNSANFNPVPDNNLYSTILSNDPSTGDPLIVGVSDYQGRIYSWYVDLSNPANCGQTPMPIIASTLGSVSLFQGSTSFNPTGIDDLVAVAFSPTGSSQNWGGIFTMGPGQIGSPGAIWNTSFFTENLENPYFGTPNFVGNNPINLVPQANGNMKQTMLFSSIGAPGGLKTEGLVYFSALGSNTLVPDPVTGSFNTAGPNNNFTTYGNLSVPVGIVDGVPPISLNGWPCDGVNVQSETDLISTSSTQSTQASVDNDFSGSVKYGGNFLKDIIGIGASYTAGVKELNTSSTGSSTTVTDEFKLSTQQYSSSSAAWLIYLAPNFVTQHVMVYDYNGNPPQAGNPMDIYLTAPSPTSPYSLLVQGYPITDPPTTGPLSGAMNSPFYNDFSAWNWTTFSGGWDDRDWTLTPGSGNYTVTPIAPGNSLDFSYGASETTQYQMTTSTNSNHESTNTVDADASIFGFGGSGSAAFTQDQTITSNIDKGIQFTWSLAMPAQGTCGYSTVIVEPVIVTGNPGTTAPLPWVPTAFQSYQPWLITYDLLQYDSTCDVSVLGPATIRTSAIPAGSGTIRMDPAHPRKGDPIHLAASPAPGYAFSHWQAYGVDIADYSSGETNGVVKTDMSTVRAYFEKEESNLVNSATISVGGPDNRIRISGIIPANFTWGMALDPKIPVRVIVGGREFAFGPKEGPVHIISDHEIYFTANNNAGDRSTLRLDFSRKAWEFTANNVDHADRIIQPGYTIRFGLTAKNTATLEDLPLTGTQTFLWTGEGGTVNNPLFSFDSGTKVIGSFAYPCQDPGRDSFIIEGARFNTSAFSPNGTLKFRINQMTFEFANATGRNGNQYSFVQKSKDCNASLIFDTGSGTWSVTLTGPRLSNNYWGDTQVIGLQIGTTSAQGTVTTGVSSQLSWPAGQSPLTAAFTGTPVQGASPLSVSFTDNSMGSPSSWYWSFGDGSTSTMQNPVHLYTQKGNYSVFLLVKDAQDTSSLLMPDYITVGTTPSFQADFSVSPVNGTAPLTVKCTDKSLGKPSTFIYNFGDGTNATGPNPVHTYRFPGVYTISLSVMKYNATSNSMMNSVATKPGIVSVAGTQAITPVANFSATPIAGTAPLTVRFTDQSTGSPTFFNYDFGDGINATARNPVHTYKFPGTYNVTLTVMKNDARNGAFVSNVSVRKNLVSVRPVTTTWKFVVFGDSPDNSPASATGISQNLSIIATAVAAEHPDLAVYTGDLVSGWDLENTSPVYGKYSEQFENWMAAMAPVHNYQTGLGIPLYVMRGNHENGPPGNVTPLLTAYTDTVASGMPVNGPSGEEHLTYSFVYRDARFIVNDEYIPHDGLEETVNQAWVDSQLSGDQQPFTFVFGHSPAYRVDDDILEAPDSLFRHPEQRDIFWQSLEDNHVSAYLCGHAHMYIRGEIGGIPQIVSGNAGAPMEAFNASGVDPVLDLQYPLQNISKADQKFGYLLITVNEATGTWSGVQKMYDPGTGRWITGDTFNLPARSP
jgi:PKD repeat protein